MLWFGLLLPPLLLVFMLGMSYVESHVLGAAKPAQELAGQPVSSPQAMRPSPAHRHRPTPSRPYRVVATRHSATALARIHPRR